ncbi:hypothetical protein G3N55_07100 [Dissulfurirhabdus thermomarina]|uniref:VCBS repeat-containing protein n=2 Tax=Dissulfurirhabdus thermomarina TaxID=1765737 RepID=A0A6N9TN90_DISTH|nr:hypothetical protein [Dissulfurirhabdus thermomarina]NDY42609.1 hypothetical protein [Dissulfurirhabdus thermomarina]
MKVSIFTLIIASIALFVTNYRVCATPQSGLPIGFVGGCEIDLNADGNLDLALLLNTAEGYELVVMMRMGENIKSYVVTSANSKTFLTCHYGKELKATIAGKGKREHGETYQVNGAYLMLTQPESSAAAYFWSKDKFKEVWISD